MKQKKYHSLSDLVYSTNPDAMPQGESDEEVTLPNEEQQLKIILDTKKRRGKVVTLIIGFVGTKEDLKTLGKQLKTKCGTGGSVKDGEILIQGDYRKTVKKWLNKWGYSIKG